MLIFKDWNLGVHQQLKIGGVSDTFLEEYFVFTSVGFPPSSRSASYLQIKISKIPVKSDFLVSQCFYPQPAIVPSVSVKTSWLLGRHIGPTRLDHETFFDRVNNARSFFR